MVKYILKQWQNKKATIFLIILGFFIGSLVLSMGTSMSVENIRLLYDRNSGDPQKQLEISLNFEKGEQSDNILEVLEKCAEYGEIQILSSKSIKVDSYGEQYQMVPVLFHSKERWHIPIIKGRYFDINDMQDEKKQIIVGKNVADKNGTKINDVIEINGEQYRVVGICGRKLRDTQWDNVLYAPWDDFFVKNHINTTEQTCCYAVLKSGRNEFEKNQNILMEEAARHNVTLSFMELEKEVDSGIVSNEMILTILSGVLIFAISVINIVNLMIYWIMERKTGLGIMKALGATNKHLVRSLVLEVISMTGISAILAIIVQIIIAGCMGDFMIKNEIYCEVSPVNVIIAIVVTTFFGLVASVIPAVQIIKIQPADSMK